MSSTLDDEDAPPGAWRSAAGLVTIPLCITEAIPIPAAAPVPLSGTLGAGRSWIKPAESRALRSL